MTYPPRNVESSLKRGAYYAPGDLRDPGLLTWTETILFFLRNAWIVVGSAVASGFLAVLLLTFLCPPRYEAFATLVIDPQQVRSELGPPILSIQGYEPQGRYLGAQLTQTPRCLVLEKAISDDTHRLLVVGLIAVFIGGLLGIVISMVREVEFEES